MTSANWAELNDKIVSNLSQHTEDHPTNQASDIEADTHKCLKRMNTCIQAAIQSCVPNKKRLRVIKWEISDRTRRLYEARAQKFSDITAQGSNVSKQLRKRWHRRIRDANLRDYNTWLEGMAKRWKRQTNEVTQKQYSEW